MPIKSEKKDIGDYAKDLGFAGVVFKEGEYVYSDGDGIVISKKVISNKSMTQTINKDIPYKLITCMKKMFDE